MRILPYKKNNNIDGVNITFADITNSKNLSGTIGEIFNTTTNGITAKKAIRDSNNKIVDFQFTAFNKAFTIMYNVEGKESMGKSFKEIYGELCENHFNAYSKTAETGQPSKIEFYNAKYDRWIETNIVKMPDGIVATHVDITELKRATDIIASKNDELRKTNHQLLESNELLERSNMDLIQFASVASHDLKEPLRKIQTFGNILQAKLKDRLVEEEMNYLNKMISASGRMQTLIEDVLTLSKLSDGNFSFAQVNLKRIVSRIIDDLEITIGERKAKVYVGQLPEVFGVAGQLHSCFRISFPIR